MNYLCSFYFLVELLLRMMAYGRGFFTRPGSRGSWISSDVHGFSMLFACFSIVLHGV